jgi:hypothetical protein
VLVLLAAAPASAAPRWHVSLGGSLAAGAQSGGKTTSSSGFVGRVYTRLTRLEPELGLRNLACRGATAERLRRPAGCPGAAGSPVEDAVSFMADNSGRIALVTVEVGGDEVFRCIGRTVNRTCVRRAMRSLGIHLPKLLARLRAVGGERPRYAGLLYPNPFLGRWTQGAEGRTLAQQSEPVVRELNAFLHRQYRAAGFAVADAPARFGARGVPRRLRTGHRGLSQAVTRICRLTGGCSRRFDALANARGHATIADAFLAVVAPLPPPPAPRAGSLGQFITPCRYSHRAPDDPIVFPNQPGASHSHDFFGNTSTNANSTFESLLAAPTRCRRAADRAGYWVPTLLLHGQPVTAGGATIYYRDNGKDPASVRPFPSGLRVVAGNAKATGPQPLDVVAWDCYGGGVRQDPLPSAPLCPPNSRLRATIRFPDCWDGTNLDSADHKSHLTYAIRIPRRSGRHCPASHPVPMAKITMHIIYPTAGGDGVTLASGPSYTEHADFFNAWEPAALADLTRRCLNADVHCGSD